MKEIWKDIPDYEGIYQASNLGRIRSLDRRVWNYNKKGRILKQNNNTSGYLYVSLNGKKWYVHVLIAKTFLENTNHYEQVNHKDFNKHNNCVDNLEWLSRIENIRHYRKSIYCKNKEEQKNNKLASKIFNKILKYKDDVIKYYFENYSIEEIAKLCGIGRDFTSGIIEIYKDLIYEIQNKEK